MKKIARKLRSRRGETLTEMLVSIVILGLSIAMMATMIITSTKITERSTAKDSEYRDQLSAAEAQDDSESTPGKGKVTITDKNGVSTSSVTVNVNIYGGDGELKSYKISEP